MKGIAIGAVMIGAVAGIGSNLALRSNSAAKARPEQATSAYWPDAISANGLVEGARPEVALRPEVAGKIAAVHVKENQDVTKGTLLVELNHESQSAAVAKAKGELDMAKAERDKLKNGERKERRDSLLAAEQSKLAIYHQAKSNFERSQKLFQSGSASREQYDQDRFLMNRTEAEWKQAKAQYDEVMAPAREDEMAAAEGRVTAAEAMLMVAQAELNKAYIKAPSDGRVLQIYAEPGETVGPASAKPVLLLANLSVRRVRAFIEELDATRVQHGQPAWVTADGIQGKEFGGKVSLVLPRMGKRTLDTDAPGEHKDVYVREVLIDLDSGDELPPNLRVQARIQVKPSEDKK